VAGYLGQSNSFRTHVSHTTKNVVVVTTGTDGEVRYKCSTAVGPEGLSVAVIDRIMPAAWCTMDKYFENMVKVSYGIMEPKDAVEEVEAGSSATSRQALVECIATAVSLDDSGTTTNSAACNFAQ
jgi:hypothetical protein